MKNQDFQPLIDKKYLLQKYPGKGGWTYAAIPEILQDKKAPFGWVRVKGFIDDYELKHCRLMPMGDGSLFFPVKAEIRKKIRKSAGDYVHITLFGDDDPLEIPEEFLACLKDEPVAYSNFMNYHERDQKAFIGWIYSSRKIENQAGKMVKAIGNIKKGHRFSDKEE